MFKRGVSLYSFQEKYYRGEMTLRDCIATAAGFGVDGFEMLADQMLPGYPSIAYNLDPEFVANWRDLISEFGVRPITLDVYGETKLRKNRSTTDDDLVEEFVALMRTAKTLGFRMLRLTFHVPFSVYERLIPVFEQEDMQIGAEVHAPHRMDGDWAKRIVDLSVKAGGRVIGLMPDMGTFCARIPAQALLDSNRRGGTPAITDYIANIYATGDRDNLVQRITAMGGNEADQWLAMRLQINAWTNCNPQLLADYAPYIIHVHGKFYQMNNDLEDNEVRYAEVLPILIKSGYQGYIMSEYEGQRLTHGVDVGYDEVEQVRRHQAMLRHYQQGGV